MLDKRQAFRVRLELKISFVWVKPIRPGRAKKGVTEDVSHTGIMLKSAAFDPIAQNLAGELVLPGQDSPIGFTARVAWSNRKDKKWRLTGLEFTRLAPADRKRLHAFLNSVWNQMLTVY